MVVHVVMIKFCEDPEKESHIQEAKRRIDALMGRIPGLRSMETGINFAREERAMDLCLRATFDDCEALRAYATHPAHLKVIDWLKGVAEYSKVVDYETGNR